MWWPRLAGYAFLDQIDLIVGIELMKPVSETHLGPELVGLCPKPGCKLTQPSPVPG